MARFELFFDLKLRSIFMILSKHNVGLVKLGLYFMRKLNKSYFARLQATLTRSFSSIISFVNTIPSEIIFLRDSKLPDLIVFIMAGTPLFEHKCVMSNPFSLRNVMNGVHLVLKLKSLILTLSNEHFLLSKKLTSSSFSILHAGLIKRLPIFSYGMSKMLSR